MLKLKIWPGELQKRCVSPQHVIYVTGESFLVVNVAFQNPTEGMGFVEPDGLTFCALHILKQADPVK